MLGHAQPGTSLGSEGATDLDALIAKTAALYAAGVRESTRKTYARRWHLFTLWCARSDLTPLPASAETVMLYLTDAIEDTEGLALSTLRGWVAAINRIHVEAGLAPPGDDPAMTMFLRTLHRVMGPQPSAEQISALRISDLRTVCRALDAISADPIEVRDRALLALHRVGVGDGEMARLCWSDISIMAGHADLLLVSPRSDRPDRRVRLKASRNKTQCPLEALNQWRSLAGTSIPWVFTLTDHNATRTDKGWDSRAIRRIRIARLASLGPPGRNATADEAIALLGGRPSVVLRDKALLLLGFAGAFRRPDLVSFTWSDLTFTEAGLVARLHRSKTDLEGHGIDVGIPRGKSDLTCPVTALQSWRDRVALQIGGANLPRSHCFPAVGRAGRVGTTPISPEALTRIVQRRIAAIGAQGRWGGRSLRAGFISTAADLDIPLEAIAKQSRHATLDSLVLYIRTDDPFRRNPAANVGL